jgi:hypothetical protein
MGLRRRVLLRLRRPVVLPVVVLAAVAVVAVPVLVARVADTLPVSVVLVTVPVAVMGVSLLLRLVAGWPVGLGLLTDSRLPGRGNAAAAGPFSGVDCGWRERKGWSRGRAGRWAVAWPQRWHPSARIPVWSLQRRRDDGSDLAGPGRRSRNGGLALGGLEEVRRCEYEANRSQNGEQAEHGCGYARKTAPHNCLIGVPAPELNLRWVDRTSRPLREGFFQHEGVRGRLRQP